jgi:hypothetical protein
VLLPALRLAGLKLGVIPRGSAEPSACSRLRLTFPENPPLVETFTVMITLSPWVRVGLVGLALRVKLPLGLGFEVQAARNPKVKVRRYLCTVVPR